MNAAYMCQPYSVILTFKHLVGDPMTSLKHANPQATYSLHFRRGRRPDHNGQTSSSRIDHTGRVTWNLTKSFVSTVSTSTYDGHTAQKLLDVTVMQHTPESRKPTQIGQACIDLASYFKEEKFSKEFWFPFNVGTGVARLHVVVNTESLGVMVEDYKLDHDTTTVGTEEDFTEQSGDYTDGGTTEGGYKSASLSQPGTQSSPQNTPRHIMAPPNIQQQSFTTPTSNLAKTPRRTARDVQPKRSLGPSNSQPSTMNGDGKVAHPPSASFSNKSPAEDQSNTLSMLRRENELISEQVEFRRNLLRGAQAETSEILWENERLQWELETVSRMLQEQRMRNKHMQPVVRKGFCDWCC